MQKQKSWSEPNRKKSGIQPRIGRRIETDGRSGPVRLNKGQPQVYGTQVDYNWEVCQAFPKTLEDSINVNQRRKKIGLPPLKEYLNQMSEMHFEINKAIFLEKGINGPKLYKTE